VANYAADPHCSASYVLLAQHSWELCLVKRLAHFASRFRAAKHRGHLVGQGAPAEGGCLHVRAALHGY
jgi:hypothetical protein